MKKSFNLGDLERAKVSNTFTEQAVAGAVNLSNPKRIYCITEVRSGGAWSVSYVNNGNQYTRNGSGSIHYYFPISSESLQFTGVTEVSGFFLETL